MKKLRWSLLGSATALLLIGGTLPAEAEDAAKPKAGAQPIELKAGDIAKSPADYYGRKIQVTAEVEDVYSAHAFTLDEDQIFAGPDVLVLNPAPRRESKDDEIVSVSGVIRPFSRTQLETEYKWFDNRCLMSGETPIDFTTRPVLIADSVRTKSGEELVRSGDASMSAGDQPLGGDKVMPPASKPSDAEERIP